MKAKQLPWVVAALVSLTCTALNSANAAATLKIGDPAPKLQVSKWVQGDPVKEFERDKVYIVEFWATWCGPCRVSIPHLNEIHQKYKDKGLVVIGQDVSERDQKLVAPFVKQMGDKMTYRVALDTTDDKMNETWMDAAGQSGIPTAFVVDKKGMIAWIGHPMSMKESMLDQVLAGTWDTKKALAEQEQEKLGEEQRREVWGEFMRYRQKEQWEKADETLTKFEKLLPEEDRGNLGGLRFAMLLDRKDYKGAYKLASQIAASQKENTMLLNQIAWTIATKEGLAERDLPLAEKIARQADETTKGKDPQVMDTLARILFLKGDKEQAIALQQKAVDASDPGIKRQLQKTLDSYKAGKAPSDK
ncbi:MAG: Redoxin domain protein [Verrucomicrobiales bacterium]|nr:Redoxin domain protein [Verrucomicrobiales bacterium]